MDFKIQEINTENLNNFKTLNKDISLIKRSNGTWDFEWQDEIDLKPVTELYSLEMGIIHACLTSWNYFNRYGNPTYATYGNRSYSLLKQNKSQMTKYKVKVFFEEVLNRMRRVYFVEDLIVYEVNDKPYNYEVWFRVVSIDDEIVELTLQLTDEKIKMSSFLNYKYTQKYASETEPLLVDFHLKNEYGVGLPNQLIYIYLNDKFYGVTDSTNRYGDVSFKYTPKEEDIAKYNIKYTNTENNPLDEESNTFKFVFKGDKVYNSVETSVKIKIKEEYLSYEIN